MKGNKFTKIIATIGPASEDPDVIRQLILAGVNIFRFNTKHNTNEWHLSNILKVKKVANELNIRVGILVDLQGPEVRIETFKGKEIVVKENDEVPFVYSFEPKDSLMWNYEMENAICIPQPEIFDALKVGDTFSIDDGFIDFEVKGVFDKAFVAIAKEQGTLKTRKGLNLVGKDVALPSLTSTDKERISMAAEANADFLGLSFVRTIDDIKALKHEMKKFNFSAHIIAKIESQKGLDNLDEIIEETDAIMVARGDLGIETPIERLAFFQKEMINKCRQANKPVIVATQMLESMCVKPRPTRAEAADVANAIYDETDCIMLSGETATGKYPVKAVETMRKIALFNEGHKKTSGTFTPTVINQTQAILEAAMTMQKSKKAMTLTKAIVLTESGFTARVLSSLRPDIPIIAVSEKQKTLGTLTINFAVTPVEMPLTEEYLIHPEKLIKELKNKQLLTEGETVIMVHGHKYKTEGTTNTLAILKA